MRKLLQEALMHSSGAALGKGRPLSIGSILLHLNDKLQSVEGQSSCTSWKCDTLQ